MSIEQRPLLSERVATVCYDVMKRQGLRPFDDEAIRNFYWLISPELVEAEWEDGITNLLYGIPVLLSPVVSGSVELLKFVDGAESRHSALD